MRRATLVLSLVLVLGPRPADAQITMNYTHLTGTISPASRTLFGGDQLHTNTSPYLVAGNGTNKLQITDPSVTPPGYELLAISAPSGFASTFYGGSVTGTMTISGTYSVAGVPTGGATGHLVGNAEYYNFLTAVGLSKLTGTASSTLASNISVLPFPAVTPGPNPAVTNLSAPIGAATAGSLTTNVSIPYSKSVTGIMDGNYPVNLMISVTAKRSHGPSQATAGWYGQDFSWTLSAPAVGTGASGSSVKTPTRQVGSLHTPAPQQGNVVRMFAANSPENLVIDGEGVLHYSAVDEASSSDPRDVAAAGMRFAVGEAFDLDYLSALRQSPSGQLVAVQYMGFADGQFDPTAGQLFTVDPYSGQTSVVPLGASLDAPTSLAFPLTGFNGAEMLITEQGASLGSVPSLRSVDGAGNVAPVVADLSLAGVDNPADLQIAPGSFGDFGNDAFVVNVGSFSETSAVSNSGSIVAVDSVNQSVSTFAGALRNPIAATFASGAVVNDPLATYLYVLEQGDLDPETGVPLGNGALLAYDAAGNRTELAAHIQRAASLQAAPDGAGLYFSDGRHVYSVQPSRLAVWDGRSLVGNLGDGTLWSSANNWTTEGVVDALPSDSYPGHDVVLATTPTVGNILLGQDRTVNTIRFEDDYRLTGATLAVTAGGLHVADGVVATIDADLVLPTASPELLPAMKAGPGTLVVNGQIEGDLNIVAGRFLTNGDMQGSIVVEGGELTGAGFIAGQVHVQPGGQLLLDATSSSLTAGEIVVDRGARVRVELGDAGVPLDDLSPSLAAGSAALGGDLAVALLDGFVPDRLDALTVLAAPSIDGMFDNVSLGGRIETVDGQGSFRVTASETDDAILLSDFIAGLAGDLTGDDTVNGADVLAWQRADPTQETWIADLAAIQSSFGRHADAASGGLRAVPEPAAALLLLAGLAGLYLWQTGQTS